MLTYQDLAALQTEQARVQFIKSAITEHRGSAAYRTAQDAEEYLAQRNVTISKYQKLLYDLKGNAHPDRFTANHKCKSSFFKRFVIQQTAYLLGNGVSFEKENVKKALGADFDQRLYEIGKSALVQGCAFGFFDNDHVQMFSLTEFVPLYDEEDGTLKVGIRFWQLDATKPLRVTLFETDGVTEYIDRQDDAGLVVLQEKRAYIIKERSSKADGVEIYGGRNYPAFPIVPLYANEARQSELVGLRENIDCYDLIKSGFANDLDDASFIYWTLENAGGMGDMDLAKFVERMKTLRAAVVDGDEGSKATAHTMDVPYQSREAYLTRLRDDMYEDFMALNTAQIAAGNVTATQINAAYEPMDNKADEFELRVIDFIQGILRVAGLDGMPTFKRSRIVNRQEETQMVLSAADYLDDETMLRKLPFLTEDEVDGILQRKDAEEAERMPAASPIEIGKDAFEALSAVPTVI